MRQKPAAVTEGGVGVAEEAPLSQSGVGEWAVTAEKGGSEGGREEETVSVGADSGVVEKKGGQGERGSEE